MDFVSLSTVVTTEFVPSLCTLENLPRSPIQTIHFSIKIQLLR